MVSLFFPYSSSGIHCFPMVAAEFRHVFGPLTDLFEQESENTVKVWNLALILSIAAASGRRHMSLQTDSTHAEDVEDEEPEYRLSAHELPLRLTDRYVVECVGHVHEEPLHDAVKPKEVQKTSVICAVSVFFPPRSDVRQSWGIGGTPFFSIFVRSNRGIILSLPRFYLTTNSSTSHPIETTTKLMSVLVVHPAQNFFSTILCFCSRSLTIFTAKWHLQCCFTGRMFPTSLQIQPSQMNVTEFFSHFSVPALQFGLCLWSWVSHSARHPTPASGHVRVFPEAFSMDVVDAEGLGLEPVGENRICGQNSEECSATTSRKMMTRLFSPWNILSHGECAWVKCDTFSEKNVRVCASSRVYCLQLPLSWREIQKKDNYKSTSRAFGSL